MKLVADMSMILVKMSIQNVEYCRWSPSIVTLATLYAATAFLKHSRKYECQETSIFCGEVRKLIFKILQTELNETKRTLVQPQFEKRLNFSQESKRFIQIYQKQFTQETVE